MNLSEKIASLRKSHAWSQEDFAEKLNVSRQAISRWENGTALPDSQNILQIAKLFDVTTDYLLNDDYESDKDIPAVKNIEKEKEFVVSKKKRLHLAAAICFTVAAFCALIGAIDSLNNMQLGLSCFMTALLAGNAAVYFVFQKRIKWSYSKLEFDGEDK